MSGAMFAYAAKFFDIERFGGTPGATRERAYTSAIWSTAGTLRPSTDERQGSDIRH